MIETFEQQLAGVLDEQRRRQRLTAKDVADLARVDPATVRRVLAGRGARITTLRLMVQALELDWRDTLSTVARRETASRQA